MIYISLLVRFKIQMPVPSEVNISNFCEINMCLVVFDCGHVLRHRKFLYKYIVVVCVSIFTDYFMAFGKINDIAKFLL